MNRSSIALGAAAVVLLLFGCDGARGTAPRPAPSYGSTPADAARYYAPDERLGGLAAGDPLTDGYAGDVRARTEQRFDEILVVERDAHARRVDPNDTSGLYTELDGHDGPVPLPLERTDVDGRIALNVGSVRVTQVYTNPYSSRIEAVYVFPLPQDAAVSDFVMKIGERRIRGIVREREEAQRIYQAARAQGHHASLLSQERPNIFTQSVANLEPGQRIDIETTYFQALPWRDGAFEMIVPTVVGPRFNPPGSTDGVGAIPMNGPPSGQQADVAYLPPDTVASNRIGIRVAIDAGVPLGEVACATHVIDVRREGAQRATITLRDGDDVPNRDFVLRFAVAGDDLHGAVAVYRDAQSGEGWFAMLLHPPVETVDVPPQPRELVFVVDCSGSMKGEPLALCQRAIRRCLDRLTPQDTFRLLRFSDSASALAPQALPATPDNVRSGHRWVDSLRANGGTMMERGVVAALAAPIEHGRRRIVTFMTDGFIGNERDILRSIHQHVGQARIFGFGVGGSPNRYLLERMAIAGRGTAAFLGLADSGAEQVDALFRRLERPALADLRLDWPGATIRDIEPARLPDLFDGTPLVVHGRVSGELPRVVRVRGRMGTQLASFDLPVGEARDHPALQKLWARARIRSLNDARTWVAHPDELADEIRTLALAQGLVSDFTSFVAVDSAAATAGEGGTTVLVPVPVPRGVRYETTVSESR